jgi:hypothetical protein
LADRAPIAPILPGVTRILGSAMDTLIFRTRPNDRNECDQWTLVRDGDDEEDFVIQEHVVFGRLLSGKPYARLIRRMTVGEFLLTDQPPAVKRKLQAVIEERNVARTASAPLT